MLLNFVTGRYHRPRVETRVSLFIDMEGSTGFAERLGALVFHRLLDRFVVDLTEPIVAARGEIHSYVGDEVIATWRLETGVAHAHGVGLLQRDGQIGSARARLPARIWRRREFPRRDHRGPVVTGEMGSVKKEIVFLGDTVNTTARIQEKNVPADRRPRARLRGPDHRPRTAARRRQALAGRHGTSRQEKRRSALRVDAAGRGGAVRDARGKLGREASFASAARYPAASPTIWRSIRDGC